MKTHLLLPIAVLFVLSSCSTLYRTGQTPDDVYFSPAREGVPTYVANDEPREGSRYRSYEYDAPYERWLRMRVRNPYRWNTFDNNDFFMPNSWMYNWNSPYSYHFNSYWNGFMFWNNFYNPYGTHLVVLNPKSNATLYNHVRTFNLNSYTNNQYNNSNTYFRSKPMYRSTIQSNASGEYNNSNTLGNSLRKVFSNSASGSGWNYSSPSYGERPTRIYTPSSGSSSGSSMSTGSSSGGGGSVVRPSRGGN